MAITGIKFIKILLILCILSLIFLIFMAMGLIPSERIMTWLHRHPKIMTILGTIVLIGLFSSFIVIQL